MQRLKRLIPLYFLVLIFLAASWALFTPNFFRVHDYTHAGRIAEMTKALVDGHFPVRWTQNFGYGYGMPLFEFYGPLPFYIGATVYWLGLSAVASIKVLYLIANAGTAWGGYLLGKRFFGRAGGLIAAAALTLAPYRAVNLFVRGALNETWAIMFLPFILLGVIKIFHREPRGWLVLCLSLTGLFLSHNITTLLFLPVLLLFISGDFIQLMWRKAPEFFRRSRFRWRNFCRIFGQLFGSLLLAVGLSSFYLFPAFLEKNLTQVEDTILSSYFDYHLHFLYIRQFFDPTWGYGGSAWGVDDNISFFLGWGQWLAAGALAVLLVRSIWLWLIKRRPVVFSKRTFAFMSIISGLFLLTIWMSLMKSQWVWDAVPLLKFVQFPWRWLGLSIIFFALLLGSTVWFIRGKMVRLYTALVLVTAMALGSAGYFRPENYADNAEDFYYTDSQLIRRELSGVLPDYISAGMAAPPSVIPEGLIINAPETAAGKYEILADRVHEKLIKTNFPADTLISLAVADYPGWRVEIDTQRWNRQRGIDGNIEVLVPAGVHLLSVRFLSTPVRQYTDLVSAVSLLLFAFLLLPNRPWSVLSAKKKARS